MLAPIQDDAASRYRCDDASQAATLPFIAGTSLRSLVDVAIAFVAFVLRQDVPAIWGRQLCVPIRARCFFLALEGPFSGKRPIS